MTNKIKILLLDIETAPNTVYTWGLWDQNISLNQIINSGHILCWAAKFVGEKKMYFSSLESSDKKTMLTEIHQLLDETDVVVHFNGDAFDIKTLNKEFLEEGFGPPSPYRSIDLYKVAKKQFRFLSNKLEYIVSHLGIGHKLKHHGFDLWIGCIAGDPKCWKIMTKYNKIDTSLLEDLYLAFRAWIPNHPNEVLYSAPLNTEIEVSSDIYCPICSSEDIQHRGKVVLKSGVYHRLYCNDCGSWSRTRENIIDKDIKKNLLVSM